MNPVRGRAEDGLGIAVVRVRPWETSVMAGYPVRPGPYGGVMTDINGALPAEPHDGIDPTANSDARAYEENQSSPVARAATSGPPPTDAPAFGEVPEVSGTGAGDPLAGVGIDDEDAANAVAGDEGPEHPGVRRSS